MSGPTLIDKVTFIRNFIVMPCQTPLTVYVETAGKPLFNLVLSFLSFGIDDVIRGFFRPKGLRSARHGRKTRRGRYRKNAIPEIGEIIGTKLNGAYGKYKPVVTDGYRHMWIIDGWVQRAIYHIFLINVVTDFWFDWLSGIMRAEETHCATRMRFLSRVDGIGPPIANQWFAMDIDDKVYHENMTAPGDFSCLLPPGNWMVVLSANAGASATEPTEVQIGLTTTPPWGKGGYYTERKTVEVGGSTGLVATALVKGGRSIGWIMWASHQMVFRDVSVFGFRMDN